MDSTTHTRAKQVSRESANALIWRAWPLVDNRGWSWLVIALFIGVGVFVWYMGGGVLLAIAAGVALAATMWQFFVPVEFEIASLGLRRRVLRRMRLVPWHAIRAYRIRPTGIVLYQRSDPTKIDLLRSIFLPYPSEPDDLLAELRRYVAHAHELTD